MTGLQLSLREAHSNKHPQQQQQQQTSELQKGWLGSLHPPTYWKYVFLTEADTILNMRASGRRSMRSALDEGLILIPHRLQPIPHVGDIAGSNSPVMFSPLPPHTEEIDSSSSSLLPTEGDNNRSHADHRVVNVKNEDVTEGDIMCCDMGNIHPGYSDYPGCGSFWYMCGLDPPHPNGTTTDAHKRFEKYQFMRLLPPLGTGIITIAGSEHSRPCRVTRRLDGKGCPAMK
jgi:hypothetical protein